MRCSAVVATVGIAFCLVATGHGMQVTGYSQAANNLYASGYPTAPVRNGDPAFVGLGYDLSGVAWNPASAGFSVGLLSPQHFLAARHVGSPGTIRFFADSLQSASVSQFQSLGQGLILNGQPDLAVGTLGSPISAVHGLPRYGVLDLNTSSSSDSTGSLSSPYDGLDLLVVGRGPNGSTSTRLATATIQAARVDANGTYFQTTRDDIQLEGGDSGSPVFHGWTNPNGSQELTLVGNNAAINETNNFMNFLGTSAVMNSMNAEMNADGWALKVVGNPTATWQGSNTNINNRLAWGLGLFGRAPSDTFVLFDGPVATSRSVNVSTNHNLRGLYFKASAAGGDGFTFSGTSVLTIGRGGVTNYDADAQMFLAPIRLGDSQLWDGGTGGLIVNSIDTNGKLLEVRGIAPNLVNGVVSGSGALALSGGDLTLNATNTYSGKTWVHAGRLIVNGSIASSSSVEIGSEGRLGGVGEVSSVSGSGAIEPGNSTGILTAERVDPTGGLDFYFEFNLLDSPDYASASDSGNDILRLTDSTPFQASLGAGNTLHFFFGEGLVEGEGAIRGGIFVDQGGDFFASIAGATLLYYGYDPDGLIEYGGSTFTALTGALIWDLRVVQEDADFASGMVSGWTLEFAPVPEPGTVLLILVAFGVLAATRRNYLRR